MPTGNFASRRPRALAELPPDALADGVAVAKAWLLELVAAAPLVAVGEISTAALAARGPRVCAAVLATLGSDRELERILPGGDLEATVSAAGSLAGADGPAAVAAAVARLRDAVASELARELRDLDAADTAALAARLACACDAVLQAALAQRPPIPLRAAPAPPGAAAAAARGERSPDGAGVAPAPPADASWRVAIDRMIAGEGEQQRPFALLAVEVDDAERLLAADPDGAGSALTVVERAVRRAAPSTALLVREREGALWMVVPGAGRDDARTLGEHVVEATAGVAAHRGAPLTVAVGVACCPQDAGDAESLVAHARGGAYAARAAGLRLV